MTYADEKRVCDELLARVPYGGIITHPFLLKVLKSHRSYDYLSQYGKLLPRKDRFAGAYVIRFVSEGGMRGETIGLANALADRHGIERATTKLGFFAKRAMRAAIHDQITEVRGTLTSIVYEVDHCGVGFDALVKQFLRGEGLRIADVKTRREEGGIRAQMLDRDLEDRWKDFHKQHAKLEVISREEHKRRTAERRRKQQH